ncbi:MAG TPA: hypothetical protein VEH81_08250 [Ktedonobacteraceae bacterium]|nr:hypothetical protein [Ktedonobacteraceae bacterium]
MLRRILIAYGVLCLIGAVILLAAHVTIVLVIYLAINGLIITGGILFERSSYRTKADTTQGKWQATGERFKDPTTGQVVEVYYNPQTGERDYRESGP